MIQYRKDSRFVAGLQAALAFLLVMLGMQAAQAQTGDRRELDGMLTVFPRSLPWEKWLQATGELPPDFKSLPSIPYLPDPLRLSDGEEVKTLPQWRQRRQELLKLLEYYFFGKTPAPLSHIRVGDQQTKLEGGVKAQAVTVEFGPEYKARLSLELLVPEGPGPFPVFMTQDNHRAWGLQALSRGYIACIYAGADSKDDTADFMAVWPGLDWTKLTRRAWAASRCVDYLYSLSNVDKARIAIAGHSRNGKTSLIAAALDERFTAVISSSSGAGGVCSTRFFSEAEFGEGIEMITRAFPDWLHPRLRFFTGRENKLPVDMNELVACLAPRPCLISTALNDSVESVWAVEQTYHSAQRAYALLGSSPALNLRYRAGGHETKAEDIECYLDWLDIKFGRKTFSVGSAPIYPTYADWLKASGEIINPLQYPKLDLSGLLASQGGNPIGTSEQWQARRNEIRERIVWGLGKPPARAFNIPGTYGAEPPATATMLGRAALPQDVEKKSINFGNYLTGDLYYPAGASQSGQKLPVVIWLHPISVSNGYIAGYRRGDPVHIALARAGYAVFAFDQIGNGSRIEEVRRFYQRFPHWSLTGRTVFDCAAAVDAMGTLEMIDSNRIVVMGYGAGGMAALHAAALDPRIFGVISLDGFTPMRLDTVAKGAGGVARYSHWMPLLPRLGAFVGNEARIPYDYHEVIAMIAPRPVLIISTSVDYRHNLADVVQCLNESRKVYDLFRAGPSLAYLELIDYNRFSPEIQQQVIAQLKKML
jgi:dienelactone hydrolase